MPIALGDTIWVPYDEAEGGWLRCKLVRRGTDKEAIVRESSVPGAEPIRIPVWIVEGLEDPHMGVQIAMPNGTIARVEP